jgi:hypothetical protein
VGQAVYVADNTTLNGPNDTTSRDMTPDQILADAEWFQSTAELPIGLRERACRPSLYRMGSNGR